jgi:Skp family chaperone for outer membrane proteins
MKKFLFVCVAVAASLLFTNTTNAQTQKIGYFDEQSLLQLFPGIGKIDTLMDSFQKDSLNAEYAYTFGDYKRKDSAFKKDSATMPPRVREQAMKELGQIVYKLNNWQQYAQEVGNNKLESLLFPYKQRMVNALQEIIKEQKYTYVLNATALVPPYYAQPPLLDNLTIRVAMKLKLPLPKDVEDAWKAATGGGAPAGAPKK